MRATAPPSAGVHTARPYHANLARSARAPVRGEQTGKNPMQAASREPVANSMLAALPRKQYKRMLDGLESVVLTFGEVLYEPGERIRHVYFPNNSLVSLPTLVHPHLALKSALFAPQTS